VITPTPIYLLAAPFSGASVLAGILGQHPALYAVPELNLFLADTVGELLEIFALGQGGHAHGLLRALAEIDFGGQTDEGVAASQRWLETQAAQPTAAVLQHLAHRVSPRRLVVPDAESPLRPMDLQRLRSATPQINTIHLLRHPWSQGVLLADWARGRLFVPQDFKDHARRPPVLDPQIAWLRAEQNLDALFAARAPLLRFRGEQLDDDFVAAAQSLCAALGLKADASALVAMAHQAQWRFAGHGPRSAPYGLEPEALETFRPAALDLAAQPTLTTPLPWRDDGLGFAPEVRRRAEAYGYC